jgi:hypothetical protein
MLYERFSLFQAERAGFHGAEEPAESQYPSVSSKP